VALGRAEDIRGFALAGVETAVCETPHEAETLMNALGAVESRVGLLMVSAWVTRAAPSAVERSRQKDGPPIVLVLPVSESVIG
jgi:vacuolar-type H+-ATPase subunit F/Vma7